MNTWIISGIILAIGLIICLFLFFRYKWLVPKKNIEEYAEARNKLTFREKKEVKKESSGVGFSLGSIVGGVISICVGLNLLPIVEEQVVNANGAANISNAINILLSFIPVFFALAIVASAIGMVANSLKESGLM